MAKLRRILKDKFKEKANLPRIFSGILGDGYNNVNAGNGKAYVRISGIVNQAICTSVPYVNNLPVWVGYTSEFPTVLRVLGQLNNGTNTFIDGIGKHAHQHEWMGHGIGGGTDVVKVHLQQFMPLRVMPYSGMTVIVWPNVIKISTGYVLIGDTNDYGKPIPATIDLTDYVNYIGGDKAQFILITIDNTGALIETEGSQVAVADLALTDIPSAPANTLYILAAVRVYFGQTEIQVNRENTDIVDLRFPMWRSITPDEINGSVDWDSIDFTNSDLDDLITKSHTSLSDIGTMTHAELETELGDKSDVGHSHTESDITDLDYPETLNELDDVNISGSEQGDILYNFNGSSWVDYALGIGLYVVITDELIKLGNADGSDYVEINKITGNLRLAGLATGYKDELQALIGQKLESPASDITIDVSEGTVTFDDGCTLSDFVVMNVQINHDWEIGSNIYPHLHWFQASANMPNWLIQYRWQVQGTGKTTAWTPLKYVSNVFTYSAGTLNQITSFGAIEAPEGADLSDIVQFRLLRDTDDDSTLFGGADPLTGDAETVNFDVHYRVDGFGSDEEYVKDMEILIDNEYNALVDDDETLLIEDGE